MGGLLIIVLASVILSFVLYAILEAGMHLLDFLVGAGLPAFVVILIFIFLLF